MPSWDDEYRQMLKDCEARESRLSEWEAQFIDSVSKQLDDKGTITPAQIEKLEDIWEKVTKRG